MLMRCTNVESKLFSTNRYLGPALFNGACKAFAYSSSNNIRTSIPWKGLDGKLFVSSRSHCQTLALVLLSQPRVPA